MSEFLDAVRSTDEGHAWRVLDEFMDALKEATPDVYSDLIRKLRRKSSSVY